MSQQTVCWTDVPVTNLDRAIAFYSAMLGAEVVKQSQGEFEFGLLPHFDSNVSGCLVKTNDNPPSRSGPLVYFSVEGRIDAALVAVREHGGEIVKPKESIGPHGFRAIVIDSEGNRIALHSQTE